MAHRKGNKYISPYVGGFFLGLVLLAAFLFIGTGLGGSGALTRVVVAIEKVFSPSHVDSVPFLAAYGGGDANPFADPLVFQLIGLMIGAFVSGLLAGRFKFETNHGPSITEKQRWMFALVGGILFGFGSKLARGCTSGLMLSGGATLAVGAFAAMGVMFLFAYVTAYFVRKLWI